MADNSARIAQIREVLRTGVSASAIDGTSFSLDLDSLRKELSQLIAEDDTQARRRPRISTVRLNNLR